jgi:predicted nicotinamide N-methyase
MDYLKTLGLSRGLKIMEVGCGWGLAGIFCARVLDAEVTCVDADPEVFHYLRLHAELNQVQVVTMHKRFEDLSSEEFKHIDLLIGGDICFWDELPGALQRMIDRALASGVQRIVLADPGRSSFDKLAAACEADYVARVFTLSVRRPHEITGRILVVTNPTVINDKG